MTRSGHTFMPTAYRKWKQDFIRLLGWQNSRAALEGAIAVFIECLVVVPRSYSEKQRQAALSGLQPVIGVGDGDNLAKGVLDALTEAGMWHDDKQVDDLRVVKRYGERDEIHVEVMPLKR